MLLRERALHRPWVHWPAMPFIFLWPQPSAMPGSKTLSTAARELCKVFEFAKIKARTTRDAEALEFDAKNLKLWLSQRLGSDLQNAP